MFGFRTPKKTLFQDEEIETELSSPNQKSGEDSPLPVMDTVTVSKPSSPRSPTKKVSAGPSKKKTRAASSQEGGTATWTKRVQPKTTNMDSSELETDAGISRPKGRLAEAKSCLMKAKLQINNSRNIKTEIKVEVLQAVDRLYQLVKEAEAARPPGPAPIGMGSVKEKSSDEADSPASSAQGKKGKEEDLIKKIEEHQKLISRNSEAMKTLIEAMEKQKELLEKTTYASVAAASNRRRSPERAALHSVVVSSKDETETGEEILTQIREAVKAKDGWVKIDRVRKARDRKVIVGCGSEEERQKVKERLKCASDRLNVEDIQNKDPLLILRDVLQYNSDEDIRRALRNQNRGLFEGIGNDDRIEIRFRRKARNPHASHVVIRLAPKLWQRMVEAETVHIDMQRIRVADYSPLVQCSLCLGYGHGRRFCKETVTKCSHCGGPHMKTECADWLANAPPKCCNCVSAKLDHTEHNAFSQECPVRRKWDALARASIAYC